MMELIYRPDPKRLARRAAGYCPNELVNGERVDWDVETYHTAHSAGTVSRSELATFAENPASYRAQIMRGEKPEPKDSMRLGQCLHMELLGGHQQAPRVPSKVLTPDGKGGWKRYGKKWEAWLEENGPYYVLPKELDTLAGMVKSIREHDQIAEFLTEGGKFGTRHESTILATHGPTGLRTRCRYDIESVWLFDIKKTADVSAQSFASHCLDFGYHCQAAFYQDHLRALLDESEVRPFILIAVEDKPPFQCIAYEMAPEFVDIGRVLNAHRLDLFAMFARAWELFESAATGAGVPQKARPEEIWESVAKGRIQFLKPPAKAPYQMEWETDLDTAHKELTRRLETVGKKHGIDWTKVLKERGQL